MHIVTSAMGELLKRSNDPFRSSENFIRVQVLSGVQVESQNRWEKNSTWRAWDKINRAIARSG